MRPRYLGIEVAGKPVPRLAPAAWHDLLNHRWKAQTEAPMRFRIIRSEGPRAIVQVDQRTASIARVAWNATLDTDDGRSFRVSTVRSWGTLVRAKTWFREALP